ncbi:MAG: O-antigen ligase family protein [Candidatus Levybacteria bacterium]|nr:O-antigen ligase family protein [Candidatus Levybacteria bacterium]
MKIINICNRVIEFSFYFLFFFIPLILFGTTSELFEFNKMWFTFGITILISVSWIIKSIIKKQFQIQKTPLDIPILLFLLSQIISTLFSWDFHVSFWGYYSRFNGGLLSTISYIALYYAFVSNFTAKNENNKIETLEGTKMVKNVLLVSLMSGVVVALWGIPSHFGYDPTCLVFRGTFDVSCWTFDFQPKVRIFSTLGQPGWLAAYLAILLPISIYFFIKNFKHKDNEEKSSFFDLKFPDKPKPILLSLFYLSSIILFSISLIYSVSRSGVLGVLISLGFFVAVYIWHRYKKSSINLPILIILAGLIVLILSNQTLINLKFDIGSEPTNIAKESSEQIQEVKPHVEALGGTDSGRIREYVWSGAIEAWKNYPLFGTGVETFAFAYYKYKPVGQNLTSEWNFLYNKAHNEFLNYLATTGIFGLGSYLLLIGYFFYLLFKRLKYAVLKPQENRLPLLTLALLSSYISILITNFFGFSVVIVNIYFFLIPAFVLLQEKLIDPERKIMIPKTVSENSDSSKFSPFQWSSITITALIALYFLYTLYVYWDSDKLYAYGSNLDKAGYPQEAYKYLHKAVARRSSEPVFKDALIVNNANVAAQMLLESDKVTSESAQQASAIAQEAINISNELTLNYSNNIVFWKSRVRMFYTLSQVDARFLPQALEAIRRASELAPNDTSILYNHGVLEGQNGNINEAIRVLEKTVTLKPDYRDPHFALGLFYHQAAVDKNGKVINQEFFQKGVDQMQFILNRLSPTDDGAKEALKSWGKL